MLILGPMNRQELQDAIEKPAHWTTADPFLTTQRSAPLPAPG
jgi:hypothetical protein